MFYPLVSFTKLKSNNGPRISPSGTQVTDVELNSPSLTNNDKLTSVQTIELIKSPKFQFIAQNTVIHNVKSLLQARSIISTLPIAPVYHTLVCHQTKLYNLV